MQTASDLGSNTPGMTEVRAAVAHPAQSDAR
jgi:hypothetical protein